MLGWYLLGGLVTAALIVLAEDLRRVLRSWPLVVLFVIVTLGCWPVVLPCWVAGVILFPEVDE